MKPKQQQQAIEVSKALKIVTEKRAEAEITRENVSKEREIAEEKKQVAESIKTECD